MFRSSKFFVLFIGVAFLSAITCGCDQSKQIMKPVVDEPTEIQWVRLESYQVGDVIQPSQYIAVGNNVHFHVFPGDALSPASFSIYVYRFLAIEHFDTDGNSKYFFAAKGQDDGSWRIEEITDSARICRVGDVIQPGQDCFFDLTDNSSTYFYVNDDGTAHYNVYTETHINILALVDIDRMIDFSAEQEDDGSWRVEQQDDGPLHRTTR